jgi:hypothetical protein
MTLIVVLNDGETYSDLHGCMVVDLTDEGLRKVEDEGVKVKDLNADTDYESVFRLSL